MQQQKQPTDNHDIVVDYMFPDTVSQIKFSPVNQTYQQFGQLLAVACWDGSIVIWKVAQGPNRSANYQPMINQNIGMPVLGFCWQVDSAALLLACSDNTIKKWDLPTNMIQNIG